VRARSVYIALALVAAAWVLAAGAAGWNPQGESQQLEAAQASAVIANAGAAAKTSYNNDGVAVFVHVKGGAMVDASIDGQKFSYVPGLTD
jgi:hypothetical protein